MAPPFVRRDSDWCISVKLVHQLLLLQRTSRQYRPSQKTVLRAGLDRPR
jgi:hypothetical protein